MNERARPISAAAGRQQGSVACEAFNTEVTVPQNAIARTLTGSSRQRLPSDLLAG
jgi:hypothetical protein